MENDQIFTNPEQKPPRSKSSALVFWVKVGYMLGFIVSFMAGSIFLIKEFLLPQRQSQADSGQVLLESKYQNTLWQGFGEVFEPLIKVPVKYPEKGFQKEEFLLDSGSLVSSLPREKAAEMGISLAKLPRSTFKGFGGTTSFAYKANLKARLGEKEVSLPVVFTEAAGTKAILGRSGFFENYSVYFNARERKIEIRE